VRRDPRHIQAMFDRIADRYDVLNRLFTLGMDVGWRRSAVRALGLPSGSLVLDLACGTGDLCRALERAGHRPIGFDFAEAMLARAQTRAPLVRADVLSMPVRDGVADGATCGFALRNVVDLEGFFAETARVLRPGGRFAVVEVSRPEARPLRWGHHFYVSRLVPWIGGLLSDREAYRYLPRSYALLPEPAELAALLRAAGFEAVVTQPLSVGIAQVIVATRRRADR
jgi:demethylmenaquinone methyltransferase/2-methoxy-6-polyprenyl-1,4-benzoquinol methylase